MHLSRAESCITAVLETKKEELAETRFPYAEP